MKHLLMDPAFPDIVAQAATVDSDPEREAKPNPSEANDNSPERAFLELLGRMDVATNRLW